MKPNKLYVLISLLFSALFLFAGTGYNLVYYCCNDCKNAGIETVVATSCSNIHESHCHDENTTHEHLDDMMLCVHELSKGCDMERLTVDVPSMQSSSKDPADYSLLFFELDFFADEILLLSEDISEKKYIHLPPNIFSPHKGRQILCQKSVLII